MLKQNSKEVIEPLIAQDACYLDSASYEISEFTANMTAENVTALKENENKGENK
ncbi:hypothetical protein STRMA_0444 [Streptococcus macacae NCTC 11558]|uniref:Uncharacterized protein n=1 Tax=Streptococcus macacae NCTC 11558 TaxID=764298 RepID=G5JZ27_9STRE|nr:hypothetical protein STRMA_0444 [Streptococcus macacae NCTC 11558]